MNAAEMLMNTMFFMVFLSMAQRDNILALGRRATDTRQRRAGHAATVCHISLDWLRLRLLRKEQGRAFSTNHQFLATDQALLAFLPIDK